MYSILIQRTNLGANVIELRNVCNRSWCVDVFGFSQLSSLGPGAIEGVEAKDFVKITAVILSSCKMKNTVIVWVLLSKRVKCFHYLPEI